MRGLAVRLAANPSRGERCAIARESAGLTVRQAARRIVLDYVLPDCNPNDLSALESERTTPIPADVLDWMATTYEVSIDWLKTGAVQAVPPIQRDEKLDPDDKADLYALLSIVGK